MKKIINIFIFLFVSLIYGFSIQIIDLGNGNKVEVYYIQYSGPKIGYVLTKEHSIKTPLGELKVKHTLWLYSESKRVADCVLASPHEIKTPLGTLSVYKDVSFYDNWKIKKCHLKESARVKTPVGEFKINIEALFYDNWELKKCYLGEEYAKIKTPAGNLKVTGLSFYEDGKTEKCNLRTLLKFNEFEIPGGSLDRNRIKTPIGYINNIIREIYFYENGNIRGLNFNYPKPAFEAITPSGHMKADQIYFFENGKINSIEKSVLTGDYIKGQFYNELSFIGWNENGEFLGYVKYDEETQKWIKKDD